MKAVNILLQMKKGYVIMLEREVFVVKNNEPNMEDMKKSIEKAGGLFYQYRPCRRVNHA